MTHDVHLLTTFVFPDECKAESSKLGLFSSVLGHVGDGNFHQMIMYHPDKPEEAKAVKDLIDEMMHKAVEMEGTVSVRSKCSRSTKDVTLTFLQGEHGIGLGKKVRHWLKSETLLRRQD